MTPIHSIPTLMILTLALFMAGLTDVRAHSVKPDEEVRATVPGSQRLWDGGNTHNTYLSGGVSSFFQDHGHLGVFGTIDHFISRNLSAGLEGGLYIGNWSKMNEKSASAGVRGSHHFTRPGRNKGSNPWDLYGGISTGIDVARGSKSTDAIEWYLGLHFGARYIVADHWLLFAESGTRAATIGLSIRF